MTVHKLIYYFDPSGSTELVRVLVLFLSVFRLFSKDELFVHSCEINCLNTDDIASSKRITTGSVFFPKLINELENIVQLEEIYISNKKVAAVDSAGLEIFVEDSSILEIRSNNVIMINSIREVMEKMGLDKKGEKGQNSCRAR